MKLFGWFKGADTDAAGKALAAWRRRWSAALEGGNADLTSLRAELEAITRQGDDIEVELELLDALEQLEGAKRAAEAGALPVVETQHRVISGDTCHYSAPASLPSDQQQANGRLLLTSARAVFVGGGRTTATPWHSVHEIVRHDRDVLFVRADRSPAAHFRFNTYADALLCAFLAGRLKRAR